jgi:hypothetical protein
VRLAPLLLAVGCAAAPPSPQQVANRLTSPALCYVNFAGNVTDKQVSSAELRARGFTCGAEHLPEGKLDFERWQASNAALAANKAAADEARKAAAREMGMRLLTPTPRPVQCYTNPYGLTTCY